MNSSADGHDDSVDDSDNESSSAASGDNDAPPPSVPDADNDEGTCPPCRRHYEDSGNNKKVLYLMSIGVTHNDSPLMSFEMAPWSLLPKTTMRDRKSVV